jgi:2-keto-4-pentenoate hydratase/2-oxohepta-3-ene-1,7-dioic acid hydratase in catechol pathway
VRIYRVATPRGPRWAQEDPQDAGRLVLLADDPLSGPLEPTDATVERAAAQLLAPVVPTKIVAVGRNYRDHAAERGKPVPAEPMLFLKPPSALIGPGEAIRKPAWAGRVEHEAELGVVIGRAAFGLRSPEAARDHILGAVCVNDVTARELQERDVQFTRAKGFDTFCPVGPCLAVGLDLHDLKVEGRVNGAVRQHGSTAQMVFPPEYLVWFAARFMTLLPGDIISTGTPAGTGPLEDGDVVEVEVEGVGLLRNPVVAT